MHLKFTILSKMELLGLPLFQQGREQFKLQTPGSFMAQCWDSRSKLKKPKNPPRAPRLTLSTARNHLWRPRAGRTEPKAQRYRHTWAAQVENFTPALLCTQHWAPTSSLHCTGKGLWESLGTWGAPGKSSAWGREGWAGSLHAGVTMELPEERGWLFWEGPASSRTSDTEGLK